MEDERMSVVRACSGIAGTSRERSFRRWASSVTWKASKQTYFIVRLLVDRDRVADAYRAYAYFRWVDDQLDEGVMNAVERVSFVERQSSLIERFCRGERLQHLLPQERLLAHLILGEQEPGSGLQSYIYHMMAVMAFDAERRGRLINEVELRSYTHWLATAVTEALHHFIGNGCEAPRTETRYLAATGAHITHMLRDTLDDVKAGYFNIPYEVLKASNISPQDAENPAYRDWVKQRVRLARDCFQGGRNYLEGVKNTRCKLAGYAYLARFESVLDAIESDGYRLRATYPEYSTLRSGLKVGWRMLFHTASARQPAALRHGISVAKG